MSRLHRTDILSMRSGGPAAGLRGLNTFSLAAEADAASSADKKETKTPLTKEQERAITPPIPKPLLPPVDPVKAQPPSPDYIKVRKPEFDAMDLSKFPASGGSGSGDGKGNGQGAKGMMGPGLAPGGAEL